MQFIVLYKFVQSGFVHISVVTHITVTNWADRKVTAMLSIVDVERS